MRAGVRFVIANPPAPRIGELQAALKTWFVERLLCTLNSLAKRV
jgi:hypothetical protein